MGWFFGKMRSPEAILNHFFFLEKQFLLGGCPLHNLFEIKKKFHLFSHTGQRKKKEKQQRGVGSFCCFVVAFSVLFVFFFFTTQKKNNLHKKKKELEITRCGNWRNFQFDFGPLGISSDNLSEHQQDFKDYTIRSCVSGFFFFFFFNFFFLGRGALKLLYITLGGIVPNQRAFIYLSFLFCFFFLGCAFLFFFPLVVVCVWMCYDVISVCAGMCVCTCALNIFLIWNQQNGNCFGLWLDIFIFGNS